MNTKKIRLITSIVLLAVLSSPPMAFAATSTGPCSTSAAQAALQARENAAKAMGQTLQGEMGATVGQDPGTIAQNCINTIMQSGMGAQISLPSFSGLLAAGQQALSNAVQGVCQQVASQVSGEMGSLGQKLSVGTTIPYTSTTYGVNAGSGNSGISYNGNPVVSPMTTNSLTSGSTSTVSAASAGTSAPSSTTTTAGGLLHGLYK